MLLVTLALLILLSVPLTGGRLARLADVRLRWTPVIFTALAIQVLIVTIFPSGAPALHRDLHLLSYVLISVFLVANRRQPGMLVIAAGGLCNATAIAANNGVMPASVSALRTAGDPTTTKTFMNSTVLTHPRVPFLGDIFAIPKSWPLHNVFSIGDICIAIGAAIAIHTLCETRLTARPARLHSHIDEQRRPSTSAGPRNGATH
ncbi:MAG TPA: DUF5317 domain-containing protein [Acidimicrobiia bacterium]